ESSTIVRLNGCRIQECETPSVDDELLRRRCVIARSRWRKKRTGSRTRRSRPAERLRKRRGPEHDHYGDAALRVAWDNECERNINCDFGKDGIVDVSDELPSDDTPTADGARVARDHFPGDSRHVLRNASIDFPLEAFDELLSSPAPQCPRRASLPVLQNERLGSRRERLRLRLLIVGVVRIPLVAAPPGAHR